MYSNLRIHETGMIHPQNQPENNDLGPERAETVGTSGTIVCFDRAPTQGFAIGLAQKVRKTGKKPQEKGLEFGSSKVGTRAPGVAASAAGHPCFCAWPRPGGERFSGIRHRRQHLRRGSAGGGAPRIEASSTGFAGNPQRALRCPGAGGQAFPPFARENRSCNSR